MVGRIRVALTVVVLAVTGAFMVPHLLEAYRVDASTDSMVLEEDPQSRLYDQTTITFVSDEFVLVGVTRDDLFTPAGIASIRGLHERFAAIEHVASVQSIADLPLPLVRSFKEPPAQAMAAIGAWVTSTDDPAIDLQKARAEILDHEIYAGNLVSRDGESAGILVTLRVRPQAAEATRTRLALLNGRARAERALAEAKTSEERERAQVALTAADNAMEAFRPEWVASEDARKDERITIVKQVREIVEEARAGGMDIRESGVPALVVQMVEAIEGDLWTFQGLSVLFLVVFLGFVFRRPSWVILPLLITILTAAWTVSGMYFFGKRITVITANIPALVLVIGLAHSIHMIVRYRELLVRFPEVTRSERVSRMVRSLVWPCLFTATTTAVGFWSLRYAGSRPIIDFGYMMAGGVTLAFLFSFLILPAVIPLLPQRDEGRLERSADALQGLAERSLAHRWVVLAIALVLGGVSAFGISRLTVEARFIDYFAESSPIHQGLRFLDERLGGTSGVEVVLRSEQQGAFGPANPDNIERAAAVVAWLKQREEVGAVMSYIGMVDELRKVFPKTINRRMATAFVLSQVASRQPDAIRPYLVTEEKEIGGETIKPYAAVRISARIQETHPGLDRNGFLRDLRAFLAETFPPETGVEAYDTGMFVLYANMLKSLLKSQVQTSLIALAAIWVMLTVLLRSPLAGLLGLIANTIPIGVALGGMGITGIPLDMATVMIASVSLGIGIDCAIHYLFRYREEVGVDGDVHQAIRRSHGSIGTSIFYTSVTTVVGFSVLAASVFKPNAQLGVLTAFAMVGALFAMLTLLPVLIAWFKPFGSAMREGRARADGAKPAGDSSPAPPADEEPPPTAATSEDGKAAPFGSGAPGASEAPTLDESSRVEAVPPDVDPPAVEPPGDDAQA